MTQEQKDLLLRDLCGRLPHGVKCKILETNEVKILGAIQYDGENTLFDFWEDDQKIQYGYQLYLSEFKPCLLPISSMTEEQKEEYESLCIKETSECADLSGFFYTRDYYDTVESIDYLYKNHIDIRGLIEKKLAIDTTGLNIY